MRRLVALWYRTPDSARRRWAAFWSLVAVALLVGASFIAWRGRNAPPSLPDPNFPTAEAQVIFAFGQLPLLVVGWILTRRATANPYGWLWLLIALVNAAQLLVQASADTLLRHSLAAGDVSLVKASPEPYFVGSGSRVEAIEWLGLAGDYLWASGILVFALLLLLFPDGAVPSARWRWVVKVLAGGFVTLFTLGWIGGGVSGTVPVRRPLSVFEPGSTADQAFLLFFDGVLVVSLLVGVVMGAVSLVVRFRRSRGVERKQIKWVMLAGFAFVPSIFWDAPGLWDAVVETVPSAAIPAAVAFAVTRYRLYDIDRILSRTVAYGLVVGLLAAIYFAGIFLLQLVLPAQSDLSIAATTLAVAALFNPVRRRILAAVDRRFNRGRYDAEQVVNAFTSRLRDEVDIDLVKTDMEAVVERVLQPKLLGLWIRG